MRLSIAHADASVHETISTLGLNLCRWSIVDIETAGNDYCRTSEGRQGVGSLEGQSLEDEHWQSHRFTRTRRSSERSHACMIDVLQ